MTKDTTSFNKQFALYMVGAFGVTWVLELILIILDKIGVLAGSPVLFAGIMTFAVFGPAVGAFLAWKASGEIDGFRSFLKKELCHGNALTIILTVVVTMAIMLITHFLSVPRSKEPWFMFLVYIPYMIFGGGFEELGWRGFLHPFLKKKFGLAVSILALGVIWAVWHLPLWFVSSTSQASENFFSFLILCVCLSTVLAVVYEFTENTAACIMIHAWFNVLFEMFDNTLTEFSFTAIFRYVLLAIFAIAAYLIGLKVKKRV